MKPMPAKIFTPERRRELGRCMDCEWDPKMQGHHELCPARPGAKRPRRGHRVVAP